MEEKDKMNEVQEKAKRHFVFNGVTEAESVEINTLRSAVKEVLDVQKRNVETLEETLGKLHEARGWYVDAKKNFKSTAKQYYEEKRLKQLQLTEKDIEKYTAELEYYKESVKTIEKFVEMFDNHVAIEHTKNDEGEDVHTFWYDKKYFEPLVALAKLFNINGIFGQ